MFLRWWFNSLLAFVCNHDWIHVCAGDSDAGFCNVVFTRLDRRLAFDGIQQSTTRIRNVRSVARACRLPGGIPYIASCPTRSTRLNSTTQQH